MSEADRETVTWEDTAQIVDDLIRQHEKINGLHGGQIILVGGSAMLAHSVRISSGDVDIYSPDLDADVVLDMESDLQKKFGEDFRIDLTPTENLWGNLLIRDIAVRSPLLRRVETPTACWDIKALDVDTLFLVKLEAGRKKDMEDLIAISPRTNAERLAKRFTEMVKWHGLPDTVMGYADRFVEKLQQLYAEDPITTIERITHSLSKHVTSMLMESWVDEDVTPNAFEETACRTLEADKSAPARALMDSSADGSAIGLREGLATRSNSSDDRLFHTQIAMLKQSMMDANSSGQPEKMDVMIQHFQQIAEQSRDNPMHQELLTKLRERMTLSTEQHDRIYGISLTTKSPSSDTDLH